MTDETVLNISILKEHIEQANEDIEVFRAAIKALEQEPCEDAISRQAVKEQMIKYGFHAPDMTVTEFVEDLPSVNPQEPFKPMVEIDLYSVIKQKYIERDVLDKIRAEIEALEYLNIEDGSDGYDKYIEQYEVLKIIDKYREG